MSEPAAPTVSPQTPGARGSTRPDRLQPGKRVERLAGATLDFAGLLVLTDRRLLLLRAALRRATERTWDVPRTRIRTAELVEGGLRLLLEEGDDVTLTGFVPPERRDEFAAVLLHRERAGP